MSSVDRRREERAGSVAAYTRFRNAERWASFATLGHSRPAGVRNVRQRCESVSLTPGVAGVSPARKFLKVLAAWRGWLGD